MKAICRLFITLSVCSFLTSQVFAQYDEDPGYEDPGYEEPDYEDPDYEDPDYEDPNDEDEPTYTYEYVVANAEEFGLFTEDDLEEAREAGRNEVKRNPRNHGLYTKKQYDDNRAAGRAEVLKAPHLHGLYTKKQYDAHFSNGRTKGHDEVAKNPAKYKLFAPSDIPDLRVAAAPGSRIAVSLPGPWTRVGQSGMPRDGWTFDGKKGPLSGTVPRKGALSLRLTPIKGTASGASVTIQIQSSSK